MSTIMFYLLACYFYLVLVWGLFNMIFGPERPSLTVLLGVPAIGLVVLWLFGGPSLIGTIVRYPIVFLSQIL